MMMMTSASASGGDGGVAGSLSEVQRATGSSTAIAKFRSTDRGMSPACSLSDISGWRTGVLYPLAGGGRESGAAHFDLQTDPHPPPGRCSGLRPHDGDVAGGAGFLCSDIPVRGDDGARAIGATDDAAAVELRGRRRRQP